MPDNSPALAEKVLLVIGGTTGLGLSAARAFLDAGARGVVVTGRNPASANAALKALGSSARAMSGDACLPAHAEEAIRLALREFGGFDGLYHVAGGSGRRMGDGPLHEITDAGWQATLDLNLTSLFNSNRAAVRAFLERKTCGSILNMGSVLGWSPSPHFFVTHAYAAAKSAVVGFTQSCAAYYAPQNIRFNVLAPALVETPMAQRAAQDETILEFIKTKQPLDGGRIGQASDLDAAAVYFLSDGSRFTTGQVLAVDGGWSVSEGQIRIDMEYALGIDLGGTNVKATAVTTKGHMLAEASVPTGGATNRRWQKAVRLAAEQVQAEAKCPPIWIGVAAPGLPARDQHSIAYLPGRLPGLEGLDWRKFFSFANSVPVLNDAQAALLGEVWLGAAQRSRNAILLTLGTGVGGAAMVDGNLLRGHLGRAGHLGHISLNPAGALDIANTPGSLEDAIGDCTVAARSDGRFASTRELVAFSSRGDADARRVWQKSIHALAAGVASLINVLDPQIVVIGGGIAKSGPELFVPLRRQVARFEWRPGGAKVRIVPAKLDDRAGAFGTAWNAIHFNPDFKP